MQNFPYIITVSSEKGGVGKTTLATNLAIYLKALQEDLPVSIFSFDNHFTVDRMFEIKGQQQKGNVADLLLETPGRDLLHTGQYGVNYIPSSTSLPDIKQSVKGPMVLARLAALSNIAGVLIIDTRPDLDILTQNALYAADRVIIPVKDMPSLENCRNIFDLFEKRGLNKKSLSLIPCLIDSRIKYDGPFRDQKELLRGYAVNRGFRCFDGFISKSPKVESLNTNPDGKIYPILTHARWTDVHGQFAQLARQLLTEMEGEKEPRSLLFYQWMNEEEEKKKQAFLARLSGLSPECLICGQTAGDAANKAAYYYEASDRAACGLLDERCFLEFLLNTMYGLDKKFSEDDPTWVMFSQSARESAFAFLPSRDGASIDFCRFDFGGTLLARKNYPLKEYNGSFFGKEKNALHTVVTTTLRAEEGQFREAFLIVHPTDPARPEAILADEGYRSLVRMKKKMAEQLSGV